MRDGPWPVVEVVELCCKWKDVDGAIIMGSAAFVRVFQGSKILIILSIITGTTPLSARINNLRENLSLRHHRQSSPINLIASGLPLGEGLAVFVIVDAFGVDEVVLEVRPTPAINDPLDRHRRIRGLAVDHYITIVIGKVEKLPSVAHEDSASEDDAGCTLPQIVGVSVGSDDDVQRLGRRDADEQSEDDQDGRHADLAAHLAQNVESLCGKRAALATILFPCFVA